MPRRRVKTNRLIPAHAGKTAPPTQTSPPAPAHPRSRGENTRPACLPSRPWPAHPRSRGENTVVTAGVAVEVGSSPLTRGKPVFTCLTQVGRRLIPAHAGKTWKQVRNVLWKEAHPRSRGENNSVDLLWQCALGSSPLTRGKPNARISAMAQLGLIPAHAGKTPKPGSSTNPRPAHPRSRGENSSSGSVMFRRPGSSPLTRGKPHPIKERPAADRLIPAHAGKTASCWRTSP